MKVVMINGSPKAQSGNSGHLLMHLQRLLPQSWDFNEYKIIKPKEYAAAKAEIMGCDVLILSFPLYVDSLPSHLLRFLTELETTFNAVTPVRAVKVYAMINCGFFEGCQNNVAAAILQNWAVRAGLPWGRTLMTGGGEMLGETRAIPMGRGPNKNISRALTTLAASIEDLQSGDNICINPSFPRPLFIIMAHRMWRLMLRKNGLARKALYAR